MFHGALAILVVVVHLLFVLYAVLGGFLVRRARWTAWIHIPVVLWAAGIELTGGICPLTPLENQLRARAGASGYSPGFLEHYLLPALYPDRMTRPVQVLLGVLVLVINCAAYAFAFRGGADRGGTPGRRVS